MLLKYKQTILNILLIIIIIFLIRGCDNNVSTTPPIRTKVITNTIIKTNTDTIYLPSKPNYIPIHILEPISIDSVYVEYNNPYEDSLIYGTITSVVIGEMLSQTLEYTPKFPKYIHTTDSIFVTTTITNDIFEKPKNQLYVGLTIVNVPNQLSLSPTLSFKDKRNNLYLYQYNVFYNTHSVGFQKLIKFKK